MAYGMLIDLQKCVGCQACELSCKAANGTSRGIFRANVERTVTGTYPNVVRNITPKLCMHCTLAPCIDVCPTGATYKLDNGIVVVDKEKCIGDQSCIAACPYGNRYFTELDEGYFGAAGLTPYEEIAYAATMVDQTVDKCDFCYSRAGNGEDPKPACVAACVVEARIFGEYNEIKSLAESESAVQLLPEENTEPCVFYAPKAVGL